jgi:hypothetical protein
LRVELLLQGEGGGTQMTPEKMKMENWENTDMHLIGLKHTSPTKEFAMKRRGGDRCW